MEVITHVTCPKIKLTISFMKNVDYKYDIIIITKFLMLDEANLCRREIHTSTSQIICSHFRILLNH